MIKILITGCKGQLGSEIQRISPDYRDMSFVFTDLEELDITRPPDIHRFLDGNPVNFLVNCAAYTAVDKAEDDEERANLLNGTAAESLAMIAAERDIQLIHISTDYVFDGEKNHPYREDDPVNPRTAYGRSKLRGEEGVAKAGKGIIVRTAWLYSVFGQNFVKTILRLAEEKDQLRVVFDQTGSPTNARDLAETILAMIRKESEKESLPRLDLFHYSNEGICSWYDFATSIVTLAGSECELKPVPSEEYVTRAKRPRYSVLSREKITAAYDLRIPHWEESLARCIHELKEK
jgi:dTDP-4-dehydrorhamnose reductase